MTLTKAVEMNPSTFDLFAIVVLLIFVVLFPLIGVWDFRRLLRWTNEGRTDARIKTYNWIFVMEWGITAGLLAWWFLAGKEMAPLGLIPKAEGWQWLAIGLGLAGTVFMIFQMRGVIGNQDELRKLRNTMGNLGNLAPQTAQEDRLFTMVSITAGVCEEILYRGLLMAVLIPVVGTWPAVGISSVIFGLAHAYQGAVGIAKTSLVGLIMALLTVFSGSLFIAILLHSIIDMTSGRIMGAAMLPDD